MIYIELRAPADRFAEDKDEARRVRLIEVLPALQRGEPVVLDFAAVSYATQSYVHGLIGEAMRKHGDAALQLLEFKNCSPAVRSVVELVVDYSLGGFAQQEAV